MTTQQPGLADTTAGTDVHVIRAPQLLDIAAAARLLRLIDARLIPVTHGRSSLRHILLDFTATHTASPGALAALRHAAYATRTHHVGLHLIGIDRLRTQPLPVRAQLSRYSMFPTLDVALRALTPHPPPPSTPPASASASASTTR